MSLFFAILYILAKTEDNAPQKRHFGTLSLTIFVDVQVKIVIGSTGARNDWQSNPFSNPFKVIVEIPIIDPKRQDLMDRPILYRRSSPTLVDVDFQCSLFMVGWSF